MRVLLRAIASLYFALITRSVINAYDEPQCKDENNVTVDWYVIYKLPKISTSSNPLIREGLAYLYVTSGTIRSGWRLSGKSIASADSIPGITLAPIYNDANDDATLWVLYNDSPPNVTYVSNYGHTKGVAVVDSHRGFWLIHSVPNFPPVPNVDKLTRSRGKNVVVEGRYNYPQTGTIYGQSFLCVSLGGGEFNTVGEQLMYNEIAVYAKNLPNTLSKRYPVLRNASDQQHVKSFPYNNKVTIASLGSVEFTSFAKGGKWNKDLYADFIAPELQIDLYVQSWLRGREKLPSTCSRRKVYNVASLNFDVVNVNYASSFDHSKWAISVGNKTRVHWVCIADINRANTQYSRGGGAMCFQQAELWSHYRNVINDIEPCR